MARTLRSVCIPGASRMMYYFIFRELLIPRKTSYILNDPYNYTVSARFSVRVSINLGRTGSEQTRLKNIAAALGLCGVDFFPPETSAENVIEPASDNGFIYLANIMYVRVLLLLLLSSNFEIRKIFTISRP